MIRPLLTLALLALLAAPAAAQAPKPGPGPTPVPEPSRLPVAAYVGGDGLRVDWPFVVGSARACVLRQGQLLHCAPALPPMAFQPQDAGRLPAPGERLELRLYSYDYQVIRQASFAVQWAAYLPSIATPPPR